MTPDPATRAREIVDIWAQRSDVTTAKLEALGADALRDLISRIAAALAKRDAALAETRLELSEHGYYKCVAKADADKVRADDARAYQVLLAQERERET